METLTGKSSGMPGGMCHSHASSTEAALFSVKERKWHAAAAVSYYYIYMIQEGFQGRFSTRFKYRRLKEMNGENEKYRIKRRKKYARQVWLKDGKAIIVNPVEKEE